MASLLTMWQSPNSLDEERDAKRQRTSSPTSAFAEDDDTAAYIEDFQLLLFEVSISAAENSRYGEVVVEELEVPEDSPDMSQWLFLFGLTEHRTMKLAALATDPPTPMPSK
ncbi:uncharacterized protein BT62DRAFT_1005443 [Guyanagaster necrorhizus]|uniref:Uncharacterized protein n=1 Tax=Guyanagaster necrorhizus TaxID=856835 RepID=A0A9P7VV62_9AGAR|nr:uncharacterized protein BT62DRAFT_1005443 [Guyanagaster necrorhizus MCA 3950]KAG7447045.1 hypothetical protein BT62DRAFT_1005443 [Guyanagaster necrorhizus MCA 3950]